MNPLVVIVPALVLGAVVLASSSAHAPGMKKTRHVLDLLPTRRLPPFLTTRRLPGAVPELVASLASKWGGVFDVPVSWIRSQAYAESKNVPTARNERTEASGLMQLLPETAEWLISSLRKSYFNRDPLVRATLESGWAGGRLFEPDVNVMLAAYYMLILKRKFGDDHNLVAAAYNIGPSRIAYNLKKGRRLPSASLTYLAMVADAKRRGFT